MAKKTYTLDELKRRRVHSGESPNNAERALWAEEAVRTFMRRTGLTEPDGLDIGISDLFGDLFHLCDGLGFDSEGLVLSAEVHYQAEINPADDIAPGEQLTEDTYKSVRELVRWQ